MKIAGMILAAALLAPVALAAQGPPGGGRMGGRMMRSAAAVAVAHKADLNLTDDQVAKLTAIDTDFQAKIAPLQKQMQEAMPAGVTNFQDMTDEQRQAFRDKMQALRPQMQTLRESSQADMAKVLKPEQVTKLQEILQQEMPMRAPGGPGGPPPRPQGN